MAYVNIEELVDYMEYDFKNALEKAVNEVIPQVQFDRDLLFKAFERAVAERCEAMEYVPDHYVQIE